MSHLYDSVWDRLSANQHCVPGISQGLQGQTGCWQTASGERIPYYLLIPSFWFLGFIHMTLKKEKKRKATKQITFFLGKMGGGVVD